MSSTPTAKQELKGDAQCLPETNRVHSELESCSYLCVEELIANGLGEHFGLLESIEDSLEWFDLLQRHVYPDEVGVRYYCVTDQLRMQTAILPVRQHRRGWVCMLESLSNFYTSLYSPLISGGCEQGTLARLISEIAEGNRNTHVMRFAPMDPGSPTYSVLLRELRAAGWIPLDFFCFGNWFLNVDGDWDDYLQMRSANLRSAIKRRSREFAAQGGVLEIVVGEENLESAIAAYQEVYSFSWKITEPYQEFVPSLIRLLASKGMLRLGIARLNGKPIAAQIWIVGPSKASIYKVAYHQAYARLSPGTILTSYLMKHVIQQGKVKEVDFLIGDDEYKKSWMSNRRERWGIIAFNKNSFIGLILLGKELLGRKVKFIFRKLID